MEMLREATASGGSADGRELWGTIRLRAESFAVTGGNSGGQLVVTIVRHLFLLRSVFAIRSCPVRHPS